MNCRNSKICVSNLADNTYLFSILNLLNLDEILAEMQNKWRNIAKKYELYITPGHIMQEQSFKVL